MTDTVENKQKIAISIDAKLLRRIDAVCQARGDNRSEFMERILDNEIDSEEAFVRDMEDPLHQAVMKILVATPGLVKVIAAAVRPQLDPEVFKEFGKLQIERGKQRAASKRGDGVKQPRLAMEGGR